MEKRRIEKQLGRTIYELYEGFFYGWTEMVELDKHIEELLCGAEQFNQRTTTEPIDLEKWRKRYSIAEIRAEDEAWVNGVL